MKSDQLIQSCANKNPSQSFRASKSNINEQNEPSKSTDKSHGLFQINRLLNKFKKRSHKGLNYDSFQVAFEEILPSPDPKIIKDESTTKDIFLKCLESLRELVFFIFTLSCKPSSRRAFQKLIKQVSNRFCKLILNCPKTLLNHDVISLASNWISDVMKLSRLDVENVFAYPLLFLVKNASLTLIKILPPDETQRWVNVLKLFYYSRRLMTENGSLPPPAVVFCLKHFYHIILVAKLVGGCCVFRPATGCSARHSLVKIICFCIKTSFFTFFVTNGKKERQEQK